LRLHSLRFVARVVASFFSVSLRPGYEPTPSEIDDDFVHACRKVLCSLRYRSVSGRLEGMFLELLPNGTFNPYWTDPDHEALLPEMVVTDAIVERVRREIAPRSESDRAGIAADEPEGVAPYCVAMHRCGRRGVIVVENADTVPASILYTPNEQGWYSGRLIQRQIYIPNHSEDGLVRTNAYGSMLVCSVPGGGNPNQSYGTLCVTHTDPSFFGIQDCAWAEVCAAQLGTMFEAYVRQKESATNFHETPRLTPKASSRRFRCANVARIEHLLSEKGMTQDDLALAIDMTPRGLSNILRYGHPARLHNLRAIARALLGTENIDEIVFPEPAPPTKR
jgi:hypothetical protein